MSGKFSERFLRKYSSRQRVESMPEGMWHEISISYFDTGALYTKPEMIENRAFVY